MVRIVLGPGFGTLCARNTFHHVELGGDMRFRKTLLGLVVVGLAVVLAVLPALSSRGSAPLVGPDLATLRFEEVQFHNGDLRLAGMMFRPEGEGPFPAAVIIHGSGSSRRSSPWYLSVTHSLQSHGIAVLLPDKRGSEKSEGQWVGASLEELAGDTRAAVDYLRRHHQPAISGIGLVGMSQGGWIAPVAAAGDPTMAFVVSMSGSSVTTDQQLLHEEIHNISDYTWPFLARLLAPLTTKRIRQMDHFRPIAGFDPIPYWKRVEAPVFFAFGENDPNVPVSASLEVLRANLAVDLVKVYSDGGHAIRSRETGSVQSEFLEDLVEFIRSATGAQGVRPGPATETME
jgi:dienelactone hydrolase